MKTLKKYLGMLEQYMAKRCESEGTKFIDEWIREHYSPNYGLEGLEVLRVEYNGEPMYVQLIERKAYKEPLEVLKKIFFKDNIVMICTVSDWIDHYLEEVKNEDWLCYDCDNQEEINQWLEDNETEFNKWLKKEGYIA